MILSGTASDGMTGLKEIKARVEDALNATKAAAQEGIVVGGGLALLRAAKVLDDYSVDDPDVRTGIKILRRALEEPLRRIAENAGIDLADRFLEAADTTLNILTTQPESGSSFLIRKRELRGMRSRRQSIRRRSYL